MKIQDALIAWNAPTGDQSADGPAKFLPRVKVVRKIKPFPNDWANGYHSTDGACGSDWSSANDVEATLNVLLLFRRLALQEGIPPLEIHRAFFEIEGYRRAGGRDMSPDGDEFNP